METVPYHRVMTTSLRTALRDGTRELHQQAERAGVMRSLLRGELPLPAYRRLLHNLLAIYTPLEAGLSLHRAHPALAPLKAPGLFRAAALRSDLKALGAQAGEATLAPATLAYAQHLGELDAKAPQLLAAHAYVRYLGDLNGGQVLARIVTRCYGLESASATAFYDFGSAPETVAHTRAFAAALDALPADDASIAALVAEAQRSFGWHVQIFEALAALDA